MSVIPVLPFLIASGAAALGAAVGASDVTLLVVGSLIAMLAGREPLQGALRMVRSPPPWAPPAS